MWIRRLFSFEWALILKSINVARTAADIFYSFPIDCTVSIWEDFCIEFIKVNKRERGSRSISHFPHLPPQEPNSRLQSKLLWTAKPAYLHHRFAAVAVHAALLLSIQFSLNGKSTFSFFYSQFPIEHEQLQIRYVSWKVDMMHDIDHTGRIYYELFEIHYRRRYVTIWSICCRESPR